MINQSVWFWAFLLAAVTTYGQDNRADRVSVALEWEFQQLDTPGWMPATVPGCVLTDVTAARGLADPFVGQGESEWAWVSEADWEYRTKPFDLPRNLRKADQVLLAFQGLDTHAEVYLNDQLVLRANNAFLPWEADVYEYFQRKDNVIRVVFHSPLKRGEELVAACAHSLPGAPVRAVTRKAQYQYGWDWGPTLPSMGITGEVSFLGINGPRVLQHTVQTVEANAENATVRVRYDIESPQTGTATLQVKCGDGINQKEVALGAGIGSVEVDVNLTNPERWWPREMGEQTLTPAVCTLILGERLVVDTLNIGIRTVELDTTADQVGQRFMLRVNKVPVYCKGANYIPQDVFLHRVSEADYRQLIDDCVAANFNMLRVWGGGIYEREVFYDLCDEAGILVWQDFMFACAMYPGDDAFVDNVSREATYHIRRLESHPCMALWCGNNEVSEGWQRWGWQSKLTREDAEQVWLSYQRMFQAVLPNLVGRHSTLPYWESSPSLGRGDVRFQFQGDAHDWTVWHDAAPFERFQEVIPRFMSEFGFQALPSQAALAAMSADSLTLGHPDLESHQKHPRGFALMDTYFTRDFGGVPDNLDDYRYLSQFQQMRGMGLGLRAQRMAFPVCAGSLYWQLNDCWPVSSWSSIDGQGQWKLLHHEARRSYAPYLLNAHAEGDTICVDVSIPNLPDLAGNTIWAEGRVTVQTFEGEILAIVPVKAPVVPTVGNRILAFPSQRFLLDSTAASVALVVELNVAGEELVDIFYPSAPAHWDFPEAHIDVQITPNGPGEWRMSLRSDVFVAGVEVCAAVPGRFSDNGFHLRPGFAHEVVFTSEVPTDDPGLGFRHLGEVLQRLP